MKITKRKLQQYFKGTCTVKEGLEITEKLSEEGIEKCFDNYFQSEWNDMVGPGRKSNVINLAVELWTKKTTIAFSAAAAILIVVASLYLFVSDSSTTQKNWGHIAAHKQNENFWLADSSRLYLSPGTELHIPEGFNLQHRNVHFRKGQAHFDVAKNKALPFTVNTSHFTIIVTGTAFTVESDSVSRSSINVTHGTVRVQDKTSASQERFYTLQKGDSFASIQHPDYSILKTVIHDTTSYMLKSSGARLLDIIRDAAIEAGIVPVIDKDIHTDCQVTLSLHYNSMQELLQIIQPLAHVEYSIDKNKIIISKITCF